jgi:general stress protein 26
MKDKMIAFMDERIFCVISTVDGSGKPESAFVGFSNEGLTLTIGTSNKSRKYKNLTGNPSVAIVIADQTGEVQYDGQAHEFKSGGEAEDKHLSELPQSAKYRQDPNQVYIKIEPTWIRFIQHGEQDSVEEFTEFA